MDIESTTMDVHDLYSQPHLRLPEFVLGRRREQEPYRNVVYTAWFTSESIRSRSEDMAWIYGTHFCNIF